MKSIAVIGAGISGLAAASLLSRRHRVHLFEQERRLGGHTHTVVVPTPNGDVPLDTGFLVHNDRTYPNLIRLFNELNVATRDSDMSFAVSCRRTGLEYQQPRRQRVLRAAAEPGEPIAPLPASRDRALQSRSAGTARTRRMPTVRRSGTFSSRAGSARRSPIGICFRIASSIWSASPDAIRSFPAAHAHPVLRQPRDAVALAQPTWKVVVGGSHAYVPKLTARVSGDIHQGAAIQAVRRSEQMGDDRPFAIGPRCPSTRWCSPAMATRCCRCSPIRAIASATCSRDSRPRATRRGCTPTRRCCRGGTGPRASWNYLLASDADAPPAVTYDLNRLQGLTTAEQYCVTLNPGRQVDERRVLRRFVYRHPLYTREAIRAQRRWGEVSGVNRTHYCGAYWFYGFHEDGLNSAIRVAGALGVEW